MNKMVILMEWLFKILTGLLTLYYVSGLLTTLTTRVLNPMKQLNQNDKVIYLTFDDGIDSKFTPLLLDLLSKEKVHASFFILASTIENNERIIKQMKDEGHIIALHGFNHKNQILQFPHALIRDTRNSLKIFNDHDITIRFSRAPWGHLSFVGYILNKVYNMEAILWNVIVQDWQKDTSSIIIAEKLLTKVEGESVICLHDGRGENDSPEKTIEALKVCIPKWKEEGYRFETVEKINQ